MSIPADPKNEYINQHRKLPPDLYRKTVTNCKHRTIFCHVGCPTSKIQPNLRRKHLFFYSESAGGKLSACSDLIQSRLLIFLKM